MPRRFLFGAITLAIAAPACSAPVSPSTTPAGSHLSGPAAYGDWRTDAPGVWRKITATDLPPAEVRLSVALPAVVARPSGAELKTLPGFTVTPFAKLDGPRLVRVAPNGDIFVAETGPGRIQVLRAADGADKPGPVETFADGLDGPFGIAFYPAGPNPRFVYVANTNSVVRFAYRSGDMKARDPAETIVPVLPRGGHSTRDLVFSADGKTLATGFALDKMSHITLWDLSEWIK